MLRRTVIAAMILGLGIAPAAARATGQTDESNRTSKTTESTSDTSSKSSTKSTSGEFSDSWLTLKTKMSLLADSNVSSRNVNVMTKNGVVTLRGKVESEEARKAAEDDARKVDGVKDVKNHLTVVASSARKTVDRRDDQIVKDVKDRIQKDRKLKNASISVNADSGIVTLRGSAPSLQDSYRASEVAHRVSGVRAVHNEVEVKGKG